MNLSSIFIFILIKALVSVEAFRVFYDLDYLSRENGELVKNRMSPHDLSNFIFPTDYMKHSDWLSSLNYDESPSIQSLNEDNSLEKVLGIHPFVNDIDIEDNREEESESHSSLIAGHQYVSGGAGEGQQHLKPDGEVNNKEEVKSDEDLPAYCDPPNPCPINFIGEDCDSRPYKYFTAEFSKKYQEQQNCMCDEDHNKCSKNTAPKSLEKINGLLKNIQDLSSINQKDFSAVVAKKSPRE